MEKEDFFICEVCQDNHLIRGVLNDGVRDFDICEPCAKELKEKDGFMCVQCSLPKESSEMACVNDEPDYLCDGCAEEK